MGAVDYVALTQELEALTRDVPHTVANLANASALLFERLPNLNWAGFYLMQEDGTLVLGPFQGRPACIEIPAGRGVCGTAAAQRSTLLVPDVHRFPGHIACDSASNSEIVIPLIHGDRVMGVLDLDSPLIGRFDEMDQKGLEAFAKLLCRVLFERAE